MLRSVRSRTTRTARWAAGAAAAALGLSLLSSVAATPAEAASPSVRVVGNHLVDAAGATVALRGVNVSGTEFSCIQGGTATSRGWSIYGGQPLDQPATFAAIAGWHANVVRVPLNEDCWLGINGVNPAYGGANYRAAIAAEVAAIHGAGLVAVLDLHWTSPGSYAAYGQQSMTDADHSPAFWSSVAGTFKSDPGVVFDLFNEPFFYYIASGGPDQWTCWLKGCTQTTVITAGQPTAGGGTAPYQVTATWQSAGMQQLVDAVRGAGATQPVIANGVDWSNDLSGWLSHRPSDPLNQVIAGWHSYPGQPCSPQSCWETVVAPLAQQVPVLVGETGDSSAGSQQYLPTFLPWARSHGLSYLAWTWNPWGDANNVLVKDWKGTPTDGEGVYVRNHLLSLPAVEAPTADRSAPVLSTRTPASGATAVATSSRVTAGFGEPVQASVGTVSLSTAAGVAVPGTVAWASSGTSLTLTPTAALQPSTQYRVSVSGVKDLAGNAAASTTWTFTTAAAAACPCSLWPASAVPSRTDGDTAAVELGVKLTPTRNGSVTAVRFYKGSANTGTHTVHVWSSTGTLLSSATATGETASGWQTVTLPTPVAVTAGRTYVVSYHAPNGRYSVDNGYFASARTAGPLTAPSSSAAGGNGVYTYGPAGSFPTSTYSASNYWVDVRFS